VEEVDLGTEEQVRHKIIQRPPREDQGRLTKLPPRLSPLREMSGREGGGGSKEEKEQKK